MLTYHPFDVTRIDEWLTLLNSDSVRRHLLEHPLFTRETLADWLKLKIEEDGKPGCRLRVITASEQLVGWCSIQLESDSYEVAIVLSPSHWGYGRQVFEQIVTWARELGHKQLIAHFSQTRPQSKALAKLFGEPIAISTIKNHVFNTYRVEI